MADGRWLSRNGRRTAAGILWVAFLLPCVVSARSEYDILIRGARVLDGTGSPAAQADVGIIGEKIAAVGDLAGRSAQRVIDATNLYLAPGFIDVHSHAGPGLALKELSHARPLLAQGITTVIVNPDGGGPVDLAAQQQRLLRYGLGVHVARMVPHGSIRQQVMGLSDREPDEAELEAMKTLVHQGMKAGGLGLSSGLFYVPGSYSSTEEVIELAGVAAGYGGVYASHIRDEGDYSIGVIAAVDEVIRIAREASLPGIVTHVKILGNQPPGLSEQLVAHLQQARDEGLQVFADQYPYEASATSLVTALVPGWAQADGRSALLNRLHQPELRRRLRNDILENLQRRGGAARLQVRYHDADPSIAGKRLDELARQRRLEPADLVFELLESGDPGLVSFCMQAADVELFMRQEWTMTCSDGDLVSPGQGVPHPRGYGSFPRKIQHYVLGRKVLSLAAAIRSMTSLPARVFGLTDRGLVRAGLTADLVLFDLGQIRDLATYSDPHQLSQGVSFLFVAGRPAIDEGRFTGILAGKVLHRNR